MNHWTQMWQQVASFPVGTPEWVIAAFALLVLYSVVVLPGAAVFSYFERKIGADFQARVGPNRAGPAGIFQPIADLLKLLQKGTAERRNWREDLWLAVHTMALYSTVAVLPLGSLLLLVDTEMSAFLPFWAALVLAFGTMLLGLNQKTVPGWFGGVRIAAQALAGSFPALVSILAVGVASGGFRWSDIAASQGASPLQWNIFANPFEFIAFFCFVASGLVLLGVAPLDGAVSIPDLHGGVSSRLSGRRLTLFRFGRFYGFFLWSTIAVVLFLGGWSLPGAIAQSLKDSESWLLLQGIQLVVILSKAYLLMLFIVWIARVNPRVRVDQVTDFSWKVLSPFALGALMGSAIWAVFL